MLQVRSLLCEDKNCKLIFLSFQSVTIEPMHLFQVDVSRDVIAASWVDIQYSEDDREPTPFEDYLLPSGITIVPDEAPKFPRWDILFPSAMVYSASPFEGGF